MEMQSFSLAQSFCIVDAWKATIFLHRPVARAFQFATLEGGNVPRRIRPNSLISRRKNDAAFTRLA